MKHAIILNRDGFRDGTVAIVKHSTHVLIGGYPYRLTPTEEQTRPEGYTICDVYNITPHPGDDGRQIWQVAVSPEHLQHLTS